MMNGDQKFKAIIAICAAMTASIFIISVNWQSIEEIRLATEAGLEQTQVGFQQLWVKHRSVDPECTQCTCITKKN